MPKDEDLLKKIQELEVRLKAAEAKQPDEIKTVIADLQSKLKAAESKPANQAHTKQVDELKAHIVDLESQLKAVKQQSQKELLMGSDLSNGIDTSTMQREIQALQLLNSELRI